MEITDDILAVCAAGLATDVQKDAVCNYLADHPEQMEKFAIMMDKNLEFTPNNYLDINSYGSTFRSSGTHACSASRHTVRVKRSEDMFPSIPMPKQRKKSPDDFWGSLIDGLDIK